MRYWARAFSIQGDERRLQQLFANLLENSLRYTQTGGAVVLRSQLLGEGVQVCIEDSAPGVRDAQLPRLFERFYRVEGSRNRASGGSGLGLLDLMLPNRDGIALCRDLRAISAVPVIMVTARVEEVDRLLGLDVGADDYICKPFSPRELVARVKAVLRRPKYVPQQQTRAILVDEQTHRAALHGQWLDLTPIEFRLLSILAMTPGRVWSRDHLMNHLYDDHRIITDRTVDSHVRNLRRKLSDAGGGEDPVPSIYGVGYRLEIVDTKAGS